MGKRGPKPKIYSPKNWSADLAYVVGLITSDGCLSKDGRHLEVTSKDIDQLETVQKILNLEHISIGSKSSGIKGAENNICYRIQWGDVGLHKWLCSIGLSPKKSKTLEVLKIPDKFFFDFLRGLWDGDGTIYSYWDPRWKSSFMFYIGFTSASPIFLLWLNEKIDLLAGIKGKITYGKGAQQLRYAKEGSKTLFRKMFYKKNLPYLERKFAKARKIFRIDQSHNARVVKLDIHATLRW